MGSSFWGWCLIKLICAPTRGIVEPKKLGSREIGLSEVLLGKVVPLISEV